MEAAVIRTMSMRGGAKTWRRLLVGMTVLVVISLFVKVWLDMSYLEMEWRGNEREHLVLRRIVDEGGDKQNVFKETPEEAAVLKRGTNGYILVHANGGLNQM
eukprot:TRINITY_DN8202_c1_g2_i14.p1 TRINITY_DN8202_c1_g2~~TRINITY_DN8202_c1_g2_i14.p1  ORF type:complete len:102 (-),score=20.50 TRINITY_DN8202_c1_g2_i14:633-938(-)